VANVTIGAKQTMPGQFTVALIVQSACLLLVEIEANLGRIRFFH